MHLPSTPSPDQWAGHSNRTSGSVDRHLWLLPVAVIGCCALVAIGWAASRHSAAPDPRVVTDDAPTLAGRPTSSIVAAAEAVTRGEGTPTTGPTTGALVTSPAPFTLSDPSDPPATTATATAGTAGGSDADTVILVDGSATSVDQGAAAPRSATPGTTGVAPPSADGGSVPVTIERPTRAFPVNRSERLTTEQLVALVEDNAITNVADFLSALPSYMGESFVLMEESRSRHQASTEYPRVIMYGPDARLLIGVSSHPLDPLREVAEVAELDEATGLWRFSQFDFTNAFVHDPNREMCTGCHGSPLRPIWGEYPEWTGAFAGADEDLTGPQADSLMRLKADPLDRFHTLVFPSDHSIRNNRQLYLPSRQYGYANTSFNFELNAAVADGIARRLLGHPRWPSDGYRLLAMQWGCGGVDAAELDATYNLFGVDGNNDFQLESPVFAGQDAPRDEYDWNQGSTGLDLSVAFRTLDLAARQDPALAAIVGADQQFVDLSNQWFNILGASRVDFLRANGIYETDFRPQNLSGDLVRSVCDHLAGEGAAS